MYCRTLLDSIEDNIERKRTESGRFPYWVLDSYLPGFGCRSLNLKLNL